MAGMPKNLRIEKCKCPLYCFIGKTAVAFERVDLEKWKGKIEMPVY